MQYLLDTNVLVAAFRSRTGASHAIVHPQSNPLAQDEWKKNSPGALPKSSPGSMRRSRKNQSS
jgi:hypothetical protein